MPIRVENIDVGTFWKVVGQDQPHWSWGEGRGLVLTSFQVIGQPDPFFSPMRTNATGVSVSVTWCRNRAWFRPEQGRKSSWTERNELNWTELNGGTWHRRPELNWMNFPDKLVPRELNCTELMPNKIELWMRRPCKFMNSSGPGPDLIFFLHFLTLYACDLHGISVFSDLMKSTLFSGRSCTHRNIEGRLCRFGYLQLNFIGIESVQSLHLLFN